MVRAKDPVGNTTMYTYTAAGRRTSSTDGSGNTITRTYDAQGRVATETAPLGNVNNGARRAEFTTTYSYDFNGNPIRAERLNPSGGKVQVDTKFDELNRPVGQVDELGKTTAVAYDNTHHVKSMTNELNETLGYSYDKAGRRTGGTDPNGTSAAEIQYDEAGNPTKQVTPNGGTVTWTYDDDGRPIATVEPRGNVPGADPNAFTARYAYDLAGNPATATDPLGDVTKFTYDANDRLVAQTDANGHTTRYGYDAADRLVEVRGPDAPSDKTTRYTYNANGMVVKRVDPLGHTSTISYDKSNRQVATVDPLGRRRENVYDANSNLVALVTASADKRLFNSDRAKRTIFFKYDALGRLTNKDLGTDGPRYAYGYDAKNRLVSLADPAGLRTQEFDDADRLKAVKRGDDVYGYEYDNNDNLKTRTYPDGTKVTAEFDVGDRVTGLTAIKGGASATYGFGYDVADNLVRTTLPASTGVVEERAYDRAGRLTQVANKRGDSVLAQFDLTLDPVANPTRVVSTRGGAPGQPTVTEVASYTFDAADRLTSACYGAQTCAGPVAERLDYTYDLVGNRTTQKHTTANEKTTTKYSYDAADQLVRETTTGTRSNERTFEYDAEGNQARAGSNRFTYNLDHSLASAKVDGKTTTYAYDASGLRISATTGTGATAVTRAWSWDIANRLPMLAVERESTGGNTAGRSFVYGAGGQPLALVAPAGDVHSYLHDWLSGVAGIVSAAGVPEWGYDYDPFGNARGDGLTDGGKRFTDDAPANPLRFTGGYSDPTQGDRYQLRARNYDPGTGRFDSVDPMPAGAISPADSTYGYVANRPTVNTDPSGMYVDGDAGGAGITGSFYNPGADTSSSTGDDQNTADGGDATADADPYAPQREAAKKSVDEAENWVKQIGDEIVNLILDLVGFNDAKKCITEGDVVACVMTALQAVPWGKLFKAAKVMVKAIGVGKRLIEGYSRLKAAKAALAAIPKVTKVAEKAAAKADEAVAAGKKAVETAKKGAAAVKDTAKKVISKAKRETPCNSFAPGTRVLMADGSTKPIERVQPGDSVLATNEANGETRPRQVTASITGTGEKRLVDLTLVGAGAGGGGPPRAGDHAGDHASDHVVATAGHPFWTRGRGWVDAGGLRPGDQLRDANGRTVLVVATARHTARATVHNITVDDKHTYYVQTPGGTTALSHNKNLESCPLGEGPEAAAVHVSTPYRMGVARRPLHHIFPQEHASWFDQRGVDIDRFAVELEEAEHQAIHGGGNWRLGRQWEGNWNDQIMSRLTDAEARAGGRKLTPREIFKIGFGMMRQYKIKGPFVRYDR
jgi:RHS repeat-associated protein